IIDTVLYGLSNVVGEAGPTVAAQVMFAVQTAINFFVPSGSGQAALTMPLMAPLSDLVGVTRQTSVLAFQMGDGFTNMIIPTSAVLMGALTLAGVPWPKWARWVLPLQVGLFVLGLIALAVATAVGYSVRAGGDERALPWCMAGGGVISAGLRRRHRLAYLPDCCLSTA